MTEHTGTVRTNRTTQEVSKPGFRAVTFETLTCATCSCGWVGPVYNVLGPDPRPRWDLNEHLAEVAKDDEMTDGEADILRQWSGM